MISSNFFIILVKCPLCPRRLAWSLWSSSILVTAPILRRIWVKRGKQLQAHKIWRIESQQKVTSHISMYKFGDVGITSNLFGSLSLTNGKWIMRQWPAGVYSRLAKVTENDILNMQDITTTNDTKKATKLGMKVFRDEQCFNTQFAHISSVFSQASLMLLSLNNCPSTAPFRIPIQVNSTSVEQNVSIQENLNVTISL